MTTPENQSTIAAIEVTLKYNPRSRTALKIQKQLDLMQELTNKLNGPLAASPATKHNTPQWQFNHDAAEAKLLDIWSREGPAFMKTVEAVMAPGQTGPSTAWMDQNFVWPDGRAADWDELDDKLSSLLQFVLPNYHDYLLMDTGEVLHRVQYGHTEYEFTQTFPVYADDGMTTTGRESIELCVPAGSVSCWEPISVSLVTQRIIDCLKGGDGKTSVIANMLGCVPALKEIDPAHPMITFVGNWLKESRKIRELVEHLPRGADREIADYLFPITFEASRVDQDRGYEHTQFLDLRTGRMTDQAEADDPNAIVVGRPIRIQRDYGVNWMHTDEPDNHFELIDSYIAHHFPDPEEAQAFIREIGIGIFGYGLPNLLFLKGAQRSGKDTLLSFVKRTLGKSIVNLNPKAIDKSGDEENDIVRLRTSRAATINVDGMTADASRLKTITSGGVNSMTARAKYAREATEIHFRGTLWAQSNWFLRYGGGNPEGITRRLMMLPLTRSLPERLDRFGFQTWEDAEENSDPRLLALAFDAFQQWVSAGMPGGTNATDRMPPRWQRLVEEGFRESFPMRRLSDFLQPTTDPAEAISTDVLIPFVEAVLQAFFTKTDRRSILQTVVELFPTAQFPNTDGPMSVIDGKYPLKINVDAISAVTATDAQFEILRCADLLNLPS